MLNIFVTGTDINVGKTFLTAGLAATMQSLGYSTCVYKPIQTGAIEKSGFAQSLDLVFVKTIDPYIKTASTYLLKETSSPIIAAEAENIAINRTTIMKDFEAIKKEGDCTIVESTGGIMTPIAPNYLVSDMIRDLDLPAIVIVRPDAGIINQTLLTINHAESKGIKVRGVIINAIPERTSDVDLKNAPRLIEEFTNAKILGIVKTFSPSKKTDPNTLITEILNGIDIESLFDVKIAKLEIE